MKTRRLIYRYIQTDRNTYFHFNEFAIVKPKGIQGTDTKGFQAGNTSKIGIKIFEFKNPLLLTDFVKFEGFFKDQFLEQINSTGRPHLYENNSSAFF